MKTTVLADDFKCTSTDPITDIHIWGSWKDDAFPRGDPAAADGVFFTLKIWDDIPDPDGPTGDGYSMPGTMLWEQRFVYPTSTLPDPKFTSREWPPSGTPAPGDSDWYDPTTGTWLPDEHNNLFQYNFFPDPNNTFVQEGTPNDPKIYWLSVEANVMSAGEEFGWRTTHKDNNWQDDATYSIWEAPSGPGAWTETTPWTDMVYPGDPTGAQHEFYDPETSVNMAFVITPEPTTMLLLSMGSLALIRRRRR